MSTKKSTSINVLDWITQSQAAELRGVSRQAINNLIKKGRLRTLELASGKLVYKQDILDFTPKKAGRLKKS